MGRVLTDQNECCIVYDAVRYDCGGSMHSAQIPKEAGAKLPCIEIFIIP